MINPLPYLRYAARSTCLMLVAMPAFSAAIATLEVDARDAPRGIERVHLVLPTSPGDLTLQYPKWLPGDHAADGPIASLAGLKFSCDGKTLAWQRDPVDMYAFHLVIPAGAGTLDVSFEVDAAMSAVLPNATRTATDALAIILWNQLILYPSGTQSDNFQVQARLRLPAGWKFGTALPTVAATGDTVQFAPVSLTTLIDSTVLAGRYFRTVELGGTPAVYLHLAADSAAAVEIPAETTQHMRKLVEQTTTLFGATHYSEYHFLWTLSDQIDFEGIEHHQSSDNRSAERSLIDSELRSSGDLQTLLPHEYVHSWNGKYRRPIGLATGNYEAPMRGELLWVYEGLTEYLGFVLSARSGLATVTDSRENWAQTAAWLQTLKGREWRPLADTATAAPITYYQAPEWRARTRGTDFYGESALLWLEADTLIRRQSHGAKSLDDFCRAFHGAPSTAPKLLPYDFNDVVNALNSVLPYDWRGFWTERLNRIRAEAPLEGLKASGWRLVFDTTPSAELKANEAIQKKLNFLFSLGFELREEAAVIINVVPGSPADLAGLAPDSHLIAVDGRKYSKDVLQDALDMGDGQTRSIRLLVEKDEMFTTVELKYAGKSRYPHLERDSSIPDLLSAITAPRS
jgi:predicted metalloprotease with PDZ domain